MRKRSQQTIHYDDNNLYTKLYREKNQQNPPSKTLHPPNDLYDQLHLSPSTGQAEFISKTETDNKNNSLPHHDQHSINLSVDTDQPKSATHPVKSISADKDISTLEQPTYTVVDKKRKHNIMVKETVHCPYESCSARNQSLTTHKTTKAKYLPNKDTTQKCTQKAANRNRLRCHQHKI